MLFMPDRFVRWSNLAAGAFMAVVGGWIGASEGASFETLSEPVAAEQTMNPHSDLIFRTTGATSCRDCHRAERDNSLSPRTLDNDLVRNLRTKAKGVHGPGRFADCLRCHAGGRKGVEKY